MLCSSNTARPCGTVAQGRRLSSSTLPHRASSSCSRIAPRAAPQDNAEASPAAVALPAVLAAAVIGASGLLPPAASAESFGSKRTRDLVEREGTPGAARPDTMKTNIPFNAPGINAPPRGSGQESGTNPVRVLKDASKQIRQNYKDPDSAPFGISRGPLVKEARKMGQPGNLKNINRAGAESFKSQSPEPPAVKAVKADPAKRDKGGYFIWLDKLRGKR